MLLAEKHYQEHPDPHGSIICCRCLRSGARHYSIDNYQADDYKADDCQDTNHSETCWLCKRCLREIGAEW